MGRNKLPGGKLKRLRVRELNRPRNIRSRLSWRWVDIIILYLCRFELKVWEGVLGWNLKISPVSVGEMWCGEVDISFSGYLCDKGQNGSWKRKYLDKKRLWYNIYIQFRSSCFFFYYFLKFEKITCGQRNIFWMFVVKFKDLSSDGLIYIM